MASDKRDELTKLRNKIEGEIAEALFIRLHEELGYLVYRTGTEFLYPHLYNISKLKKNAFQYKIEQEGNDWHHPDFLIRAQFRKTDTGEIVLPSMEEMLTPELKEKSRRIDKQLRFSTLLEVEKEIYHAPDFLVITPQGFPCQFEVKYRYNGELTEDEQKKYLKYHPYTLIFVFMAEPPYVNIYYPNFMDVDHLKIISERRKYISSKSMFKIGLELDKEEIKEFNEKKEEVTRELHAGKIKPEEYRTWTEHLDKRIRHTKETQDWIVIPILASILSAEEINAGGEELSPRLLDIRPPGGDPLAFKGYENWRLVYKHDILEKYGKLVNEYICQPRQRRVENRSH